MADDRENRTERASERRKREARQKGQVAISREVPTAAMLLAALALIYGFIDVGIRNLVEAMRGGLSRAAGPAMVSASLEPDAFRVLMYEFGWETFHIVLPFLLGMMVVGAGSYIMQIGLILPGRGLKFDPSRLNPISGLGRLVSLRSLVELVKSILKVLIIGLVGFTAVGDDVLALPALVSYDLGSVLVTVGLLMAKLTFWLGITIAVLAVADYAYQRFEWERGLRMTKEEVKQEHKEAEGDPLLRARIRSLQRDLTRNRMMTEVPKADVVVTNPQHLAVALRYDATRMSAPIVVAKGAGYIAERIKQIAMEHGVMVIENQFVARSLHRLVEVGQEIPTDLYRAVAEILALVYRARSQTTLT